MEKKKEVRLKLASIIFFQGIILPAINVPFFYPLSFLREKCYYLDKCVTVLQSGYQDISLFRSAVFVSECGWSS